MHIYATDDVVGGFGHDPGSSTSLWIGSIIAIAMMLIAIGAIVRVMSHKKIKPLTNYSSAEICDRVGGCDDVDDLFFILQDILAYTYGDTVRSYAPDEIKSHLDDAGLSELLRVFEEYQYTDTHQISIQKIRDAFISYAHTYDSPGDGGQDTGDSGRD